MKSTCWFVYKIDPGRKVCCLPVSSWWSRRSCPRWPRRWSWWRCRNSLHPARPRFSTDLGAKHFPLSWRRTTTPTVWSSCCETTQSIDDNSSFASDHFCKVGNDLTEQVRSYSVIVFFFRSLRELGSGFEPETGKLRLKTNNETDFIFTLARTEIFHKRWQKNVVRWLKRKHSKKVFAQLWLVVLDGRVHQLTGDEKPHQPPKLAPFGDT